MFVVRLVRGWLPLAVVVAGLTGCGGCDDEVEDSIPPATFEILEPGTGPENVSPLEPMRVGSRTRYRVIAGQLVNGHYEVVDLPEAIPVLEGTPRGGGITTRNLYRRGPHGIEWLGTSGGLAGRFEYGRMAAAVVVPDTVRLGMVWESGTLDASLPNKFTVSGRSEELTPLGVRVLWTITPTYGTAMRYVEGLGFVVPDGAELIAFPPSAFPMEPTPSPSVPPAASTSAIAIPGGALDPTNFGLRRATALVRDDGTYEVALAGGAIYLDDGVPSTVPEYHCLELSASGTVTAVTAIVGWMTPQRFPWVGASGACEVGDLSMVRRNSPGLIAMTSRGGRDTLTPFVDTSGFYNYAALWVKVSDGDPWVLRTDGQNFGWQRPEDGSGMNSNSGPPWSFGPPTTASAGILGIYDFDPTGVTPRHDGPWFAGTLPDLRIAAPQYAYHLSSQGMLFRVHIRPKTREVVVEPLFPLLEALTIVSNLEGEQRVLATSVDGVVRRLVLEPGAERLEILGRVALASHEQVAGALSLANGDVLVFLNDTSASVQRERIGGEYWRPRFSIRKARLTGSTSEQTPPVLGVRAKIVGADAVVCWPPTETPLDPAGWTLGGSPATPVQLAGLPCAVALRDPATTTEQLGALDANAVVANVPDVGRMEISTYVSSIPTPSSTAAMVGDIAILDARNHVHVGGVPIALRGFGIAATTPDDVAGAYSVTSEGLSFHNPLEAKIETSLPSFLVFDVVAPALGGGVIVSAHVVEAAAFSGSAYLVRSDGSSTYLASATPTNRAAWLPDGRSCIAGTTLDCYAPDATSPYVSIAISGGSFVGATLRTFADGSVMAIAGGNAYRVDLTAGTATVIDAGFAGTLGGLTRRADGSLWAVVAPGPSEVAPPRGRIARIRPDGIDVYTFPVPAYVPDAANAVATAVNPGSSVFSVTLGSVVVRIPAPAP